MTKQTVTRVWVKGLRLFIVGAVVVASGVVVMFANGGTWSGAPYHSDFFPTPDALFSGSVAMMSSGGALIVIGGILQLSAWMGAVRTTAKSMDTTWFVLLLALGVIGLQPFIMGAYVVAGPDGRPPLAGMQTPPSPTSAV